MNKEIRNELNEIQYEKNLNKIKLLSGAIVGVGAIKAGQILAPKAIAMMVGQTMFMGSLAIPGYFVFALGAASLLPVYSAYKKGQAEKADRKAEEIKNEECFNLED